MTLHRVNKNSEVDFKNPAPLSVYLPIICRILSLRFITLAHKSLTIPAFGYKNKHSRFLESAYSTLSIRDEIDHFVFDVFPCFSAL